MLERRNAKLVGRAPSAAIDITRHGKLENSDVQCLLEHRQSVEYLTLIWTTLTKVLRPDNYTEATTSSSVYPDDKISGASSVQLNQPPFSQSVVTRW
ncbi:hypothetical protein ElyMa_004429300 [Elysia marginata]|uniref:Uncharacterized protein n=1 Tax=Elysia marginata TaxID=1093978 RepID=A0AAV4HF50_9GAST|nr:hypothetical protein ElyMa_004429300 [Elysia marginata]